MKTHLIGLALATSLVAACSAQDSNDTGEDEGAATIAPTITAEWVGPEPGLKSQPISASDKTMILAAWNKTYDSFYKAPGDGYLASSKTPTEQLADPADIQGCLAACPAFWGDLVCHFYSSHPSYSATLKPNIRSCFSGATRDLQRPDPSAPGGKRRVTYWEAYDHCVFQAGDWVNAPPEYKEANIAANKRNWRTGQGTNPLRGDMAWVERNERDAFRYVMFTGYNPEAFDWTDEQEVINRFYGIPNPRNPSKEDCLGASGTSKRPLRPDDPTDGTHCSPNKPRMQANGGFLTEHPATLAAVASKFQAYKAANLALPPDQRW